MDNGCGVIHGSIYVSTKYHDTSKRVLKYVDEFNHPLHCIIDIDIMYTPDL